MKAFFSRVNERVTGAQGLDFGEDDSKHRFQRLFQVSIEHTFYNAADFACPDFVIVPTEATAALMKSLGLLFRDEGTGFSVLVDQPRISMLESYLERNETNPQPEHPSPFKEPWTRLSFILAANNPYFVNQTCLPIDFPPAVRNLYFTNRDAHGIPGAPRGSLILNRGAHVACADYGFPAFSSSQYQVPWANPALAAVWESVKEQVKEVRVLDISGACVLCMPRCIPAGLAVTTTKPVTDISCQDVTDYLNRQPRRSSSSSSDPSFELLMCTDTLYLDFSTLPEGKYTIELIDVAGQVMTKPLACAPWDVINTIARPIPVCMVDMLFVNPTGERPFDVYPMHRTGPIYPDSSSSSSSSGELPEVGIRINEVSPHYRLIFERRSTFWRYLIVPQRRGERLSDLEITSYDVSPVGTEYTFGPAEPHKMPNGVDGWSVSSKTAIPLSQQSILRFRLKGMRGYSNYREVPFVVEPLPVASAEQVRPAPDKMPGAWNRLRKSVRNRVRGLGRPTYSDIYVYV